MYYIRKWVCFFLFLLKFADYENIKVQIWQRNFYTLGIDDINFFEKQKTGSGLVSTKF